MRYFLIIAATLLWTGALQAETPPRLVVTGEGVVRIVPDLAILTLGLAEEAPSAEQAVDEVSRRARTLFKALDRQEIASEDIQTRSVSVKPVRQNGRQARFRADTKVTIRLRRVERLGRLLGLAVADGANDGGRWSTRLRFDATDRASYEREARIQAVRDARAKASVLAEASGARLGPVREIREGPGNDSGKTNKRVNAASAEGVSAEADELTVEVTVRMIFDLLP